MTVPDPFGFGASGYVTCEVDYPLDEDLVFTVNIHSSVSVGHDTRTQFLRVNIRERGGTRVMYGYEFKDDEIDGEYAYERTARSITHAEVVELLERIPKCKGAVSFDTWLDIVVMGRPPC